MIKVVANDYVKEESVGEFLRLAKEIVEKTNANDKGCIAYQLWRDKDDPLHFAMLEEWESMEDLNAHMQAPHFREIIPQFGPLMAKPGVINVFEKAW